MTADLAGPTRLGVASCGLRAGVGVVGAARTADREREAEWDAPQSSISYIGHCLNLPHTKYGFTIHFGRSQGDILAYVAPVQRSDRQGNSLTKRYDQSLNCHRLHSGPPRTQYVHTHTLPILCMPYPSLRSPGDILRERAPVLSCDRQDNSITKRFAQSCNSHRVHQQPQAATTHSHPTLPIPRV